MLRFFFETGRTTAGRICSIYEILSLLYLFYATFFLCTSLLSENISFSPLCVNWSQSFLGTVKCSCIYLQVNFIAARYPEQIFGEKEPQLQRKINGDLLVFSSKMVPPVKSCVFPHNTQNSSLQWLAFHKYYSLISGSRRDSEANRVGSGLQKMGSSLLSDPVFVIDVIIHPRGQRIWFTVNHSEKVSYKRCYTKQPLDLLSDCNHHRDRAPGWSAMYHAQHRITCKCYQKLTTMLERPLGWKCLHICNELICLFGKSLASSASGDICKMISPSFSKVFKHKKILGHPSPGTPSHKFAQQMFTEHLLFLGSLVGAGNACEQNKCISHPHEAYSLMGETDEISNHVNKNILKNCITCSEGKQSSMGITWKAN